MAKRKIKEFGKNTEVNAEGNEKDDNTTSSLSDISAYDLHDSNPKIAGMANGYKQARR